MRLITIRITGLLQGNEGWWLITRGGFSDKDPHLNSRQDAQSLLGVLGSGEVRHLFRAVMCVTMRQTWRTLTLCVSTHEHLTYRL